MKARRATSPARMLQFVIPREHGAGMTDSRLREQPVPKHEKQHMSWEAKWSRDDYEPPWAERGIPEEVPRAIKCGWLPASGDVLDIGCGLGDVAAWFAHNGYTSVGIDIAESAILKATRRHGAKPPTLTFAATDICSRVPEGGPFDVLLDRGCLHGIPPAMQTAYVRNLLAVSGPRARMMLFMRIHREKGFFRQSRFFRWCERKLHENRVRRIFAGSFRVARSEIVDLTGANADSAMPGVLYFLERE